MPPGADRRLLLVILVTIILVPSVFGASVYISNEVAPDLQFIPLPYHAYWTYVNSMCFYGYNEEYIAVARFDGLHIVDRYFSNVTGPIKVSNNTWHSGAYDLASSLTDESSSYHEWTEWQCSMVWQAMAHRQLHNGAVQAVQRKSRHNVQVHCEVGRCVQKLDILGE